MSSSFRAFVLDQLSALDGVEARPMFGGAGFYLRGGFFGILYKDHLYFRVSTETISRYTDRGMPPFTPFEGQSRYPRRGRPTSGMSLGYYEVPVDILESPADLVAWAKAAHMAPRKAPLARKSRKKR